MVLLWHCMASNYSVSTIPRSRVHPACNARPFPRVSVCVWKDTWCQANTCMVHNLPLYLSQKSLGNPIQKLYVQYIYLLYNCTLIHVVDHALSDSALVTLLPPLQFLKADKGSTLSKTEDQVCKLCIHVVEYIACAQQSSS